MCGFCLCCATERNLAAKRCPSFAPAVIREVTRAPSFEPTMALTRGAGRCTGDRFTLGDEEGDELTHLGRSLAEGDAFEVRAGLRKFLWSCFLTDNQDVEHRSDSPSQVLTSRTCWSCS